MLGIEQLLAHLWGDFVLQNDWMALNKKKASAVGWCAAVIHCAVYTAVFPIFVSASWKALVVIFASHLIIDHFDFLPRFIWARNWLAPRWLMHSVGERGLERPGEYAIRNYAWEGCQKKLGFSPQRPDHLVWLIFIVIDNTLHLTINYFALRYL